MAGLIAETKKKEKLTKLNYFFTLHLCGVDSVKAEIDAECIEHSHIINCNLPSVNLSHEKIIFPTIPWRGMEREFSTFISFFSLEQSFEIQLANE